MKGLVITTENKMFVQEFGEPLYKTVGEAVGGYIEIVHPKQLPEPYVMIVNEEGLIEKLPVNDTGCSLCGVDIYDFPIVGNIVLMKEGIVNGEPDIIGLEDHEIMKLRFQLGNMDI